MVAIIEGAVPSKNMSLLEDEEPTFMVAGLLYSACQNIQ